MAVGGGGCGITRSKWYDARLVGESAGARLRLGPFGFFTLCALGTGAEPPFFHFISVFFLIL